MESITTRTEPPFWKLLIGRLFFIYGMTFFLVSTIVIAFICLIYNLFVKDKIQRGRFFYRLSFYWIRFLLLILFSRIKIHNPNSVLDQPHIYVPNHRSFLDIWLSTPLLPQANFTIGKSSFAKVPLFGIIYKMGSVLVDRKSAVHRRQSFLELQKYLTQQVSVCIYPEGTRNQTNQILLPFQNGAFKLSMLQNTSIILVAIQGTANIFPPHIPFYLFPGSLTMHLSKPIEPKNYASEMELKDACFSQLTQMLNA